MKSKKNYLDIGVILLWIAAILASLKSIFTDTGFDNAYTVAMAYRHISGDNMITGMWEPHQTSMFFVEMLMRLYRIVVPSYTGVVLFLQLCGTILFGLICIPLYKLISKASDKYTAHLACIFFFIYKVKQSPFPDYSNLLIAFSMLMLICLLHFIQNENDVKLLILAGVFLCLAVLAYPSGVIIYISAVIILVLKSKKKLSNALIFTVTCAAIGICYGGYFVIRIGLSDFVNNLSNIFLSDSHSKFMMYTSYFQSLLPIIIWIAVSLILGIITSRAVSRLTVSDYSFLPFWGVYLIISGLILLIISGDKFEFTCAVYSIPFLLIAFSLFVYKDMTELQRTIWLGGILVSIGSFFAAFVLTDLSLITVLSFLIAGGTVSIIPVCTHKKEALSFVMCLCIYIILHRGLVIWGYGNKWGVTMIYQIENVVRRGPSAGIVGDYMTYYMTEQDIKDHNLYITSEDKVLLVDTWLFDPIEFMLIPGEISNPSTIDTPIYNEHTLDYFVSNPGKTPTVIVVSCWYGQLMVDEDTFIMNWINENYEPVADGSYWRYYRVKQQIKD